MHLDYSARPHFDSRTRDLIYMENMKLQKCGRADVPEIGGGAGILGDISDSRGHRDTLKRKWKF
jgi:hypothetical protein